MKKQATRFRANKLYSENTKRPGDRRHLPLQVLGRGTTEGRLCAVCSPRPAGFQTHPHRALLEGGSEHACHLQS